MTSQPHETLRPSGALHADPAPPPDVECPLRTEGLHCAIGGRVILSEVDLSVDQGRLVALVGPNGAGKSTLLRTLAGILPPVTGTIWLSGRDHRSLPPRERAQELAFVGQRDQPGDDQFVEEVVMLGRLPHRPPWSIGNERDRAAVRGALAQVGMTRFARRPYARLSGGEQRRALIARGLAQQAPLLLLDEPTNHLDIGQQHQVMSQLRMLDSTVVAALHDLNLASAYADDVVVIDDGRVLAQGPVAEVLTPELVGTTFQVQATEVHGSADGRLQWLFAAAQ